MSRKRWVYTEGGQPLAEPIEVSSDWSQPDFGPTRKSEEEIYGGLRASDGADISSRKKHRDYMRATGSAMASDFTQTWEKARKERASYFTEGGTHQEHRERRETAAQAAYEVKNRRRK